MCYSWKDFSCVDFYKTKADLPDFCVGTDTRAWMIMSNSTKTETTAATTRISMLTRSEVEDDACWGFMFA